MLIFNLIREKIIEVFEDKYDLKCYKESMKEYKENNKTYTLYQVKKELEL